MRRFGCQSSRSGTKAIWRNVALIFGGFLAFRILGMGWLGMAEENHFQHGLCGLTHGFSGAAFWRPARTGAAALVA
jgi:hypothetical protein